MRSVKTPGSNPVIKRVMAYAVRLVPDLKKVRHQFCQLAEDYHKKSRRVFAHTHCSKDEPHTICWCRAMRSLSAAQVAGICVHELGHILAGPMPGASEFECEKAADVCALGVLHLEIHYIGKDNIQAVDPRRLGR